ncbi:MAG: molybdopterin dinucleotide binding domain-containing protein, partial [Sulfurimicrobium sp.]|nr:molybdopterin dinucleotide binding domain-containing protein [Sulfurimicrobium sp.]
LMPDPLVEIHPDTATNRGIRDGDWVEITTATGRMRARARFEKNLAPEVVCAQYGWWQFADGSGDANRLIDGEYFDPVAGSNSLRYFPCEVSLSPAKAD